MARNITGQIQAEVCKSIDPKTLVERFPNEPKASLAASCVAALMDTAYCLSATQYAKHYDLSEEEMIHLFLKSAQIADTYLVDVLCERVQQDCEQIIADRN